MAHVDWRKLVSSKTKEKATPEEAQVVGRVMAHSKITSERSYVRTNLTKLGAEAVKVKARVTCKEELKKERKEKLKKGDFDSDSPKTLLLAHQVFALQNLKRLKTSLITLIQGH